MLILGRVTSANAIKLRFRTDCKNVAYLETLRSKAVANHVKELERIAQSIEAINRSCLSVRTRERERLREEERRGKQKQIHSTHLHHVPDARDRVSIYLP